MRMAVVVFALFITAGACSKQKPIVKTLPDAQPFLAPNKVDKTDAELAAEMEFVLLRLKRVHFAMDSTVLTVEARLALRDARARLDEYPGIHLYVEGHADAYGSAEYNIGLAEKRATAVCDYMARLGMTPERLHVVSWGEEQPLAASGTPNEHARNRRVEFRLKQGELELHLEDGDLVASR